MQPVQNCIHSDMQFEETLGNAQWVNQFFLNSQEFLENSREISLLALDLEAFSFHFSLSISISRHFHFTFHSRSRTQGICISLFILEMSESDFHFTFHFSNKKWKRIFFTFTSRTFNIHSRWTLPDPSTGIPRKFPLHWILVRLTAWEVEEFSKTFLSFVFSPTITRL